MINFFVGVVSFLVSMLGALRAGADDILAIQAGAFGLLFAFTYLWVGINRFLETNGQGLGWYCLFVAITAVPIAIDTLSGASGQPFQLWMGLNWSAWAVLWFVYFLLLVPGKVVTLVPTLITLACAILTAWIPGFLVLTQRLAV